MTSKTALTLAHGLALLQGADNQPADAGMTATMQTLLVAPDLRGTRAYVLAQSEGAYGLPMTPPAMQTARAFEASTPAHVLRFAQEASALCRRLLRESRIRELRPVADAGLDPAAYVRDFALKPAQARKLIDTMQGGTVDTVLIRELQASVGSVNVANAQRAFFAGKQAATEIARLEKLNAADLTPSEAETRSAEEREAKAREIAAMIEAREREMASIAAARKQAADAEQRLAALGSK